MICFSSENKLFYCFAIKETVGGTHEKLIEIVEFDMHMNPILESGHSLFKIACNLC